MDHCVPQVLTLQGPWSERDAQMTETFARLQDIYGVGRVLGILGKVLSACRRTSFHRASSPVYIGQALCEVGKYSEQGQWCGTIGQLRVNLAFN